MKMMDSDVREIRRRIVQDMTPLQGKTLLLVGGGGFIGQYIAQGIHSFNQLSTDPCNLVITDVRLPTDGLPGINYIQHDVLEEFSYDTKIDYIMFLAGIPSPKQYRQMPLETLKIGVLGTLNMLEFARKNDVNGFLTFSSSEIYGSPPDDKIPTLETYNGNVSCIGKRSSYDEGKRVSETLSVIYNEVYGLPTKIVRPFNIFGAGIKKTDGRIIPTFVGKAIDGESLPVHFPGTHTRTFCYGTDAAVGFILALLKGKPGNAYNIGNPEPEVSTLDLVNILGKVMGQKLQFHLTQDLDAYPEDQPKRRCPNITKAKEHLGYYPQVTLEDGLRRFVGWARPEYGDVE